MTESDFQPNEIFSKIKISKEIFVLQTLVQLTQRLKQADDLLLGEWQNDAGVDLMTAAQSGGSCPKYDKLIHCSGDRPSRYLQEALNCFEESRKLGSVKGTFNLGLCYEQGLGTCINLQKVLHSCVKQ